MHVSFTFYLIVNGLLPLLHSPSFRRDLKRVSCHRYVFIGVVCLFFWFSFLFIFFPACRVVSFAHTTVVFAGSILHSLNHGFGMFISLFADELSGALDACRNVSSTNRAVFELSCCDVSFSSSSKIIIVIIVARRVFGPASDFFPRVLHYINYTFFIRIQTGRLTHILRLSRVVCSGLLKNGTLRLRLDRVDLKYNYCATVNLN